MARAVRSQIIRRPVDASQLSVLVIGSNVHITGVIRPLAGHRELDMKSEMNTISDILKSRGGISDVVWDVTIRS
jgi:hypothetical protein